MSEERAGEKDVYREMLAAWQKMMSEGMDTFLRSPLMLATMGKGLESSLNLKEHIDQALHTYLQALHLPSTRDVERVLEALQRLQGEVETLTGKVDQLLRTEGRRESRPATRQAARRRRGDTRADSD
ncbi:MAG: hypothetical protein ACE5IQ_02270 [Candidatus Methylomirabilales bacterium]